MNSPYADIIHLPHHVSQNHPQMPMLDRAAQFAPFAALTGYEAAVGETARLTAERRELDAQEAEELNRRLAALIANLPDRPGIYCCQRAENHSESESCRVKRFLNSFHSPNSEFFEVKTGFQTQGGRK